MNENIVEWASEEFCIPYLSPLDGRVHRYFPDFLIKVKERNGSTKTYVVEVNPKDKLNHHKESQKVTKSFINEAKTFEVNSLSGEQQQNGVKIDDLNLKL